jgi:replicative DNA helicase
VNARLRESDPTKHLRLPPQSIPAEQAVLGGVMLSPTALALVGDMLTEDDFYRRDHRMIWRAVLALDKAGQPFDALTLGNWLESKGVAEQIGGTGYLVELASSTPSAANVRAHAEIVRDRALRRQLIDAGTQMVNDGFEPEGRETPLLVSEAQRNLGQLARTGHGAGLEAIKPALKGVFEDLSRRWELGETMTGISTPWPVLNDQTFGLQDGDLYILAGRPSMGKTIMGEQLAAWVAEHHGDVAFFSVEMNTQQLLQRSIAREGGVPHEWLRSPAGYNAKAHEDDRNDDARWAGVNQAMRKLSQLKMHIDQTRGITGDQIVSRARRYQLKHKLRLIMVDHLHIIAVPGKDPVREIGEVSRQLKALAGEIGCPVVVLAQLNRANNGRTDKRPMLSDLRASGDIEQNADDVWFLHREDYYRRDKPKTGLVELIIAKARNAQAGGTLNFKNRFDQMRLDPWEGDLPAPPSDDAPKPRARTGGWSRGGKTYQGRDD